MKSLLLHINPDSGMEARLQVALDLARAHDAHITCLQAVTLEVFAPGDFYGSVMAPAVEAIKKSADNHREKLETRLKAEDVSWEWLFINGRAEMRLMEYSSLADLVIIGAHDIGNDASKGPSDLAAHLALNAAAPVLVVPETVKSFDAQAPALVAWNGSSQSCAALRASVPMLKKANETFLACVTEEKSRDRFDLPPLEGARYLARYDIDATVLELTAEKRSIADTLEAAAEMRECGFVVMGAYGHSRLAEFLMGGVTRKLLSEPKLPVLITH